MADFDKVILNGTTYTIPQGGSSSFDLSTYTGGSCINFNYDTNKILVSQSEPQTSNYALWLCIMNFDTNKYETAVFWCQYGFAAQRSNEWSSIFSGVTVSNGIINGSLDFTGFDTDNLDSCIQMYTCSQFPYAQSGYTITDGAIDDTVLNLIMQNQPAGTDGTRKTMVTGSEQTMTAPTAIQRLYDNEALKNMDTIQSTGLSGSQITKTVRRYSIGTNGSITSHDASENVLKIDTDSFGYDSNSGLTFTQPYIDGTLVSQNLTPVFTVTDFESDYSYEGGNYFNAIVIDIVPSFADGHGNANINIDYPSGSGYTYGYVNISYDSYSGLRIDGQLTQNNYKSIDGVFGTKNLLLFPSMVNGPATISVMNDNGLITGVSFYNISDNDKLSFSKWQTNVMTHIYGSDDKEEVTSRALNYLNNRIAALEAALAALQGTIHDLQMAVTTIDNRTQNVITTTETQLFGEAVVDAGGFSGLDTTDSATVLAELGYQPSE